MAERLEIPLDRYRNYESRFPLPIYLIEPFAEIVGYSVTFVVTGRGDRADADAPYTGIDRRRAG